MTTIQDEDPAPSIRFKRRKITHQKRNQVPVPSSPERDTESASAGLEQAVERAPIDTNEDDEDESVPNLKEILRNRARSRHRLQQPAHQPEVRGNELVPVEAAVQDKYTSRFVAQTGQIVDRDDRQMTEFVEARLAEQNYRKYGWPVPSHLQSAVVALAPDLKHIFTTSSSSRSRPIETEEPVDAERSNRLAAGKGKIEEVDLGERIQAQQTGQRIQRPEEESAGQFGKARHGFRRRQKRRNSEDIRRDEMVEAVLRESKLEYFDEPMPSAFFGGSSANNDDALAAQFQADYLESLEEARQQRKPVMPAGGAKGVKEAPKGPKLGGSKSTRAKILKAQEEEKKAGSKR